LKTFVHITWFSQHHNAASKRGGGEGLRLQSQEGQDLCAAATAEHLIFKTSTEEQTVDLTVFRRPWKTSIQGFFLNG